MSNRLVHTAKGYIQALFKDFKWMYTKDRDWALDLRRLLSQLDSRGIIVMLEDLPAINKHLNLCLDGGTYTNPGLLLSRPKRGEQLPAWCRQLFLRVFHPDGGLLADPDTDAIFYLKTLLCAGKTIKLPSTPEDVLDEVSNFFKTDAMLPNPTLMWDRDNLDELWASHRHHSRQDLVSTKQSRARELSCENYRTPGGFLEEGSLPTSWLRVVQGCFDIIATQYGVAPHLRGGTSDTDPKPRHGPGVVAYLPEGISKYRFPNWPDKLQSCFPYDTYALPNFGWGYGHSSDDAYDVDAPSQEYPSRMIAVPKTLRKPRLIAAEPVENQWIQQLVWRILENDVNRTSLGPAIDFRDQERNAQLALRSSRSGSHATVDLSEASDRLTTRLVERFWRANPSWIETLWSCRSRVIRYEGKHSTSMTWMRKFAPMGSSVTFPMQTIIFSALCAASHLIGDNRRATAQSIRKASSRFRVFGDDIIIEVPYLGILKNLLTHFDLKVNVNKTFSSGKFRESCGIEAYNGDDVTPARLQSLVPKGPTTVPSFVEVSNNYFRKGLWNASAFLRSLVTKYDFVIPVARDGRLVPKTRKDRVHGVDLLDSNNRYGTYYSSFLGESTSHLRRRWNAALQVDEVRVLKTRVKSVEGDMLPRERLLQYFTEAPDPMTNWKSGFSLSRTVISRPGWVTL
jgi:hypothetical protein